MAAELWPYVNVAGRINKRENTFPGVRLLSRLMGKPGEEHRWLASYTVPVPRTTYTHTHTHTRYAEEKSKGSYTAPRSPSVNTGQEMEAEK